MQKQVYIQVEGEGFTSRRKWIYKQNEQDLRVEVGGITSRGWCICSQVYLQAERGVFTGRSKSVYKQKVLGYTSRLFLLFRSGIYKQELFLQFKSRIYKQKVLSIQAGVIFTIQKQDLQAEIVRIYKQELFLQSRSRIYKHKVLDIQARAIFTNQEQDLQVESVRIYKQELFFQYRNRIYRQKVLDIQAGVIFKMQKQVDLQAERVRYKSKSCFHNGEVGFTSIKCQIYKQELFSQFRSMIHKQTQATYQQK